MRFFKFYGFFFAISTVFLPGAANEPETQPVFVSTYLPSEFDGTPSATVLRPDGSAFISVNRMVEGEAQALILQLQAEGAGLTLWRQIPGTVKHIILQGSVLYVTGSAGTRAFLIDPPTPDRVWTHQDGRQLQGTLESVDPTHLTLGLHGRSVRFSKELLSAEDLHFLQNEAILPRVWRDTQGRSLWGKMVHADAERVDLQTPRGTVQIPLTLLAESDQAYVQRFREQLGGGIGWERVLIGQRLTPGPEGTLFVKHDRTIHHLDTEGKEINRWTFQARVSGDIVYDPKTDLVFVTGFDNRSGRFRNRGNWPIQVAFVKAWRPNGERVWTAYRFSGQAVLDQVLEADTRGYLLEMGEDGLLYLGGESAGGATLWYRSSKDVTESIPFYRGDMFQNWFNTRSNHITAVVALDPKTGDALNGTLILARGDPPERGPASGNTLVPKALAALPGGGMVVGGVSAYRAPVDEPAFGAFHGGGAFVIGLRPDFTRRYATNLTLAGQTTDLSASRHGVLVVGTTPREIVEVNPIGTPNPLQEKTSRGWIIYFRPWE